MRSTRVMALALAACGDGSDLAVTRDVTAASRDADAVSDADVDAPTDDVARCGACFAWEEDGCDPLVDLAVGRLGACVVLASGEPICWGRPSSGALGEGLHGRASLPPFRVRDRPPLVALGVAASHACGLDAAGDVWCWGSTYHGIPGGDRRELVVFEAAGPRLSGARALVVGPVGAACALVDDGVWCWGQRLDGAASDEIDATFAIAPERVAGVTVSTRAQVAIGAFTACVWDPEVDRLACFGANGKGQLGAGADVSGGPTPRSVVRVWGSGSIEAMAVGDAHACVAVFDGAEGARSLWCWGALAEVALEPVRVATDLPTVHALAAGRGFTCAIVGAARSVTCWGAPPPTIEGAVELSAADASICARTRDERVTCWRVDRGAVDVAYTPEAAARCGDDADRCLRARAIAAGDAHTCALGDDGDLWCWGDGRAFGVGPEIVGPTRLAGLPALVALTAGAAHACALDATGAVHCVGDARTPAALARADAGALDAGGKTTCVITPEGAVACETPAGLEAIDGLDGFVPDRVAVGGTVACVSERNDGVNSARVACWGRGDEGQLGVVGPASARATFVPALGLPRRIGSLAAGRAHVLVASAGIDIEPYGWGADDQAQLGGGVALVSRPAQILGERAFNLGAVAAGDAFSCALERTGRLACFGSNAHGQLGPATARPGSATPVEIVGPGPLAHVVSVAAGARHACAIDRSGLVACWGDNRSGQLGGGHPGSDFAPEPRQVILP